MPVTVTKDLTGLEDFRRRLMTMRGFSLTIGFQGKGAMVLYPSPEIGPRIIKPKDRFDSEIVTQPSPAQDKVDLPEPFDPLDEIDLFIGEDDQSVAASNGYKRK